MRIVFYILFTLSGFTLFGQEMYWGKPARFITSFHFKQLNGGVILVKAQFDNLSDTFNFILDTGSGGISLDSTTTEKIFNSSCSFGQIHLWYCRRSKGRLCA